MVSLCVDESDWGSLGHLHPVTIFSYWIILENVWTAYHNQPIRHLRVQQPALNVVDASLCEF